MSIYISIWLKGTLYSNTNTRFLRLKTSNNQTIPEQQLGTWEKQNAIKMKKPPDRLTLSQYIILLPNYKYFICFKIHCGHCTKSMHLTVCLMKGLFHLVGSEAIVTLLTWWVDWFKHKQNNADFKDSGFFLFKPKI